jgi:hypothetical protein
VICRLHYYAYGDNIIRCRDVTNTQGISYYAIIDYNEGTWKLLNSARRNVIKSGASKNKNVLRRMVRRELIGLGVRLEKEFKKESGYAKTSTKIES